MFQELKIIVYPDPRLKKISQPVTRFDQGLKDLAARMLELMRDARGVGLAAPQVGRNIRLFVMNQCTPKFLTMNYYQLTEFRRINSSGRSISLMLFNVRQVNRKINVISEICYCDCVMANQQ